METLKVFTAFSGYDSQCLALEELKAKYPFDYELVGWSEIDKYAIKAHDILFPQYAERNYGDISKIDWNMVPDFDLFTYSSPCQDFSNAGLQRGGEEGSGTRSSLLWECRKAILAKKPKYLLMENVAALVSSKFIKLFQSWMSELESYGYRNYGKVLNAKDYGVPQNRERIFLVSILSDQGKSYYFPEPFKLRTRLRDVLEADVPEKYYLSDKQVESINASSYMQKQLRVQDKELPCDTLCARDYKDPKCVEVYGYARSRDAKGNVVSRHLNEYVNCIHTQTGNCRENMEVFVAQVEQVGNIVSTGNWNNPQRVRIYSAEGISPAINTAQGGGQEPKILSLGNYSKSQHNASRVVDTTGISPAVMENHGTITAIPDKVRIRKLTPRECFRLMGVKDKYITQLIEGGISNSQLYKMAGNSIVVDVLEYIFTQLLIADQRKEKQLELF